MFAIRLSSSEPDFPIEDLLVYSRPNAPLKPVTDSPLGQGRRVSEEIRAEFNTNRFVVYNRDRQWRKAAEGYARKPAFTGAVCGISLDQSGPLKIQAGLTVVAVGVNGKDVSFQDGETSKLSAGKHRLLLVFEKNVRGAYYKEMPTYVNLTVNGMPIHYMPVEPRSITSMQL